MNYINVTPEICNGQPHIAGRRVTVQNIVVMYRTGVWDTDEIALRMGLTEAQVRAALRYYQQHRAAIDNSIRANIQRAQAS